MIVEWQLQLKYNSYNQRDRTLQQSEAGINDLLDRDMYDRRKCRPVGASMARKQKALKSIEVRLYSLLE